MEEKQNKGLNSGVYASTGFEFQKHCALYLILDDYNNLSLQDYYIYFEHHEDFLFCFLNSDKIASFIKLYQAKKSNSDWNVSDLKEVIISMCNKCYTIKNDNSIDKSNEIIYNQYFITNAFINFAQSYVNDSNSLISYKDLKEEDKLKIKEYLKDEFILEEYKVIENPDNSKRLNSKAKKWFKELSPHDKADINSRFEAQSYLAELNNIYFFWIDLNKTAKEQKNALIGKIITLFGSKISDPTAAVDTLLLMFKGIELRLNQGGEACLSNTDKRISSSEISEAMKIITEKSMAIEEWRNQKKDIANELQLTLYDQMQFQTWFIDSFDCFKDIHQAYHQKILQFVFQNKDIIKKSYTVPDFVNKALDLYKQEYQLKISEIQLKAILFAAYHVVNNEKTE